VSDVLAISWYKALRGDSPRLKGQALDELRSLLRILRDKSADSTLGKHANSFKKWVTFARDNEISPVPPVPLTQEFHASFYRFVLKTHKECAEKKYLSGREQPCQPKTFDGIFHGINHIFERVYGVPGIRMQYLNQAKSAYRRRFSRPKRKARPLTLTCLERLVNFASATNIPWMSLTSHTAIVMHQNAMRWSCVDNVNVQKTFRCPANNPFPVNPDPQGRYSLFYYYKRKSTNEECISTVPLLSNKNMDARTSFLYIRSTWNRKDSRKLLPRCTKRGDHFTIDSDPSASCTYDCFLNMYRQLNKLAGNGEAVPGIDGQPDTDWTPHGPRRGFVNNAREDLQHEPLALEVMSSHGAWAAKSVTTMLGYNDVRPERHAKIIANLYESTPHRVARPAKRQRTTHMGRKCKVNIGGTYLTAYLALSQPTDTGNTSVLVHINSSLRRVPRSTVRLLARP